jgi:hypothetical protein
MKHIKTTLFTFFCVLIVQLSGCATYGSGVEEALQSAQKGHYLEAEQSMTTALTPTGVDRLLYHMELAVLKHLQGQYLESNQLLETAEKIAEELEVTRVSDSIAAFMTNPRNGDYTGADFEKVFINYYKTLNYMALSSVATTKNSRLDAIESARIESRRLGIRLNALNSDKGTYAEQKDEDGEMFSQLLDIFSKLQGNLIDHDKLEYRDDAMAHYLTGITYEANREYDNARISYRKAAVSYEEGFSEQFGLGSDMTKQAWFDTVRMMRKAGGYNNEWPRLAKKKLTKDQIKNLSRYDNKSQIIVIEHVGMMPQRKEMNVQLSANAATQSLELRPYVGDGNTDIEKLAWFYIVYADKSLLDLVANYYDATFVGFLLNDFSKTLSIGPAWDAATELGIINAIGTGIRITVPYYAPPKQKPGVSFVTVNDEQHTLKSASKPAIMGLNEQLLSANSDIQLALARGAFKALTAQKVGELAGGPLGSLLGSVGQIAGQLSDAAETRNWLMLPYEVRVSRIALDAGSYSLAVNSEVVKGKSAVKQEQQIILQEDELQVVQVRSMPYLNQAAAILQQNKIQKSVALIEQ